MAEPEPSVEPETVAESEYEPEPEAESLANPTLQAVILLLFSLWMLFILSGNLLVVLAICTKHKLRSQRSNWYLVSLCTAGLWIAVFVIPAELMGFSSTSQWMTLFCKLCEFFGYTGICASIFTQIGIWLVSAVLAIPNFIIYDVGRIPYTNLVTCTMTPKYTTFNRGRVIFSTIILFFCPLAMIGYFNMSTVRLLKGQSSSIDKASNRNLVNMLLTLVLLFALMLLPFNLVTTLVPFGYLGFLAQIDAIFPVCKLVIYAYEWVSIFICLYFDESIRRATAEILRKVLCCKHKGRKSNFVSDSTVVVVATSKVQNEMIVMEACE